MPLIALYLAAIVAANLVITELGPAAVIPVGFALIGFDLTARDRLHDRWARHGRAGLAARMGALIAAGGALAWLLNADAGRIAVASVVAFTVAAVLDTVVYARLAGWHPRLRAIYSNVPAAAADSYLFLAIAFPGPAPLLLVLAQFAAKTLGGAVWALILYPRRPRTIREQILADLGQ